MSYYIRKNGVTKKLVVIPEGYPAELIGYDNTGTNLQSNNAQDAITELDSGKVSKSGDTMLGNLYIDRHNGTTSQKGYSYIVAGNDIPEGTEGNSVGGIKLWGANNKYAYLYPASNLDIDCDLHLPKASSGTLALENIDTYLIKGWLLTDNQGSSNTKIYGVGVVRIIHSHYVEVEFSAKIEQISTSSSGYLRLNVATLRNRNSNIPLGIQATGNGICTVYDANGVYSSKNGYGGVMTAINTSLWELARMYNTSGDVSPYTPNAFSVGDAIVGKCYGYLP